MAQKSAGAFIDTFLPRLSQLYRRGGDYSEVEDLDTTSHQGEGSRVWGSIRDSFKNINFLHSHVHRK